MKKSEINSSFFLAQTTAGRQAGIENEEKLWGKGFSFFTYSFFYSILCIQYNM